MAQDTQIFLSDYTFASTYSNQTGEISEANKFIFSEGFTIPPKSDGVLTKFEPDICFFGIDSETSTTISGCEIRLQDAEISTMNKFAIADININNTGTFSDYTNTFSNSVTGDGSFDTYTIKVTHGPIHRVYFSSLTDAYDETHNIILSESQTYDSIEWIEPDSLDYCLNFRLDLNTNTIIIECENVGLPQNLTCTVSFWTDIDLISDLTLTELQEKYGGRTAYLRFLSSDIESALDATGANWSGVIAHSTTSFDTTISISLSDNVASALNKIKFGNNNINSIYLGSKEVKKVYLGSTLVWSPSFQTVYDGSSGNITMTLRNGKQLQLTQVDDFEGYSGWAFSADFDLCVITDGEELYHWSTLFLAYDILSSSDIYILDFDWYDSEEFWAAAASSSQASYLLNNIPSIAQLSYDESANTWTIVA